MISFNEVHGEGDLLEIEKLAAVIWHEHYTPIIGKNQVVYMLQKFQSVDAMSRQISQGFHYLRIDDNGDLIGYLAYEKRNSELFLSKIYVLKQYRGKGVGKRALQHVMDAARELNCGKVTLTVNKLNTNAIKAYEKTGFIKKGPVVQDIGLGYVMDDFIMEKQLEPG